MLARRHDSAQGSARPSTAADAEDHPRHPPKQRQVVARPLLGGLCVAALLAVVLLVNMWVRVSADLSRLEAEGRDNPYADAAAMEALRKTQAEASSYESSREYGKHAGAPPRPQPELSSTRASLAADPTAHVGAAARALPLSAALAHPAAAANASARRKCQPDDLYTDCSADIQISCGGLSRVGARRAASWPMPLGRPFRQWPGGTLAAAADLPPWFRPSSALAARLTRDWTSAPGSRAHCRTTQPA